FVPVELIIRQVAPALLQLSLELLPGAFDRIRIHGCTPVVKLSTRVADRASDPIDHPVTKDPAKRVESYCRSLPPAAYSLLVELLLPRTFRRLLIRIGTRPDFRFPIVLLDPVRPVRIGEVGPVVLIEAWRGGDFFLRHVEHEEHLILPMVEFQLAERHGKQLVANSQYAAHTHR